MISLIAQKFRSIRESRERFEQAPDSSFLPKALQRLFHIPVRLQDRLCPFRLISPLVSHRTERACHPVVRLFSHIVVQKNYIWRGLVVPAWHLFSFPIRVAFNVFFTTLAVLFSPLWVPASVVCEHLFYAFIYNPNANIKGNISQRNY